MFWNCNIFGKHKNQATTLYMIKKKLKEKIIFLYLSDTLVKKI